MGPRLLAVAALGALLAGCLAPAAVEPASLPAALDLHEAVWDTAGNYSRVLQKGTLAVLPVETLTIPSFDGTPIASAVWRPEVPEGERVPVVLTISPYFTTQLAAEERWTKDFFLENLVPRGYAYAHVAVRGTSDSGGCMESMGGKEQRDFDEVVTHFGAQPWSDGNVAIIGVSYVGTTPWAAAAFGNPHLKAIVPISGVTSWAELGFRNGTSEARGPIHAELYWLFYGLGLVSDDPTSRFDQWAGQACPEVADGQLASAWAGSTGETEPGPFADYWAMRDFRQRVLENYRGAVYVVHGLQDWNVDPDMVAPYARELQDAGLDVRMMLGQWAHSVPDNALRQEHVRWDWAEKLLRWLDVHLRGASQDLGLRVDVEDNRGLWRTEAAWPPADAAPLELHLGDGVLAPEPTPQGEAAAVNPAGAVDWRRCTAWALGSGSAAQVPLAAWTFLGEPLERPLRFAGMAQVHVTAVPTSPAGGILHAELWDVGRAGAANLLAHGAMNLRFHAGGREPQAITPGQPVLVQMELKPADVVLPAGHRLALWVTPDSTAEACNDFNEVTSGVTRNTLPSPTPIVLQWGGGKSVLRLPAVERDVGDGRYPGQPVLP